MMSSTIIFMISIRKVFFLFPTVFLVAVFTSVISPVLATAPASIGGISPPPGVKEQIAAAPANTDIAILYFFSNIIKIATVFAGIFVMYNFAMAAFTYITGQGKAESHQKVRDKITMSVIGLLIIVLAYVLAAIFSLIIFGDASFILKPTVQGPVYVP